jgi:hypothetical protein
MRVARTYSGVLTPTNQFVMNYYNLQIIPAKLSRIAKQHPSNSAHLMRRFVRVSSIYVCQFFISIDFRALFLTRAPRGAGVVGTSTYLGILNTTVNVMRP